MPQESSSVEACKAWNGTPLYQLHICILQPEKRWRIHFELRVYNTPFSTLQCNLAATCTAAKLNSDATNNAKMKHHSRRMYVNKASRSWACCVQHDTPVDKKGHGTGPEQTEISASNMMPKHKRQAGVKYIKHITLLHTTFLHEQ